MMAGTEYDQAYHFSAPFYGPIIPPNHFSNIVTSLVPLNLCVGKSCRQVIIGALVGDAKEEKEQQKKKMAAL